MGSSELPCELPVELQVKMLCLVGFLSSSVKQGISIPTCRIDYLKIFFNVICLQPNREIAFEEQIGKENF